METLPLPQLTVGTRLYVKKENRIMPNIPNSGNRKRQERIGGIPFFPGFIVEILEIKDNAARIQIHANLGRRNTIGTDKWWYDLDKFSPNLFGIDHRNRNTENRKPMLEQRATELLEGEGKIRSTDRANTVLNITREAHQRLIGSDEPSS